MLYGAIDTGAKFGMIPMDRALAELVKSGMIDLSEAVTRAHNPEVLKQLATGGAAARPAAY
jgi:Tfp pilus assembly pilus retraction ATPase PilT